MENLHNLHGYSSLSYTNEKLQKKLVRKKTFIYSIRLFFEAIILLSILSIVINYFSIVNPITVAIIALISMVYPFVRFEFYSLCQDIHILQSELDEKILSVAKEYIENN